MGGGVGIYVKSSINFSIIDNLTIMKEKLFESVFINIEFCNKTLLVGCLYRSPSSDVQSNEIFVSTLKNCLNLVKINQKCIITGDLNYDLANCENEHVNNFTEIMFENCYSPLINKPTRITDLSASVLDHMWTNIYMMNPLNPVLLPVPYLIICLCLCVSIAIVSYNLPIQV